MVWWRWKFWRLAWSLNRLGSIGSIVTFEPEGVWRPLPFCSRLVWFTPAVVVQGAPKRYEGPFEMRPAWQDEEGGGDE